MQIWPEFIIPPQAAALAARSRSASARTIIGSLPPSSRLTGVSVSAARAITLRPVRSEPVNWMKSTASTRAPPVSPIPCTQSSTSGPPISSFQALTTSARPSGRELRGLDHHRGAGLQGRDRVAEGEDQREVPGADDADHRVGPVLDAQLLRGEQRRVGPDALLADELGGLAAVEVDQVGEVGGLVGRRRRGPCRSRPASCRRPARCCRAASRAACRASGSGPRSPSPPTRPGWRAPGRRSRRRPRASRRRPWRPARRSPGCGPRSARQSRRRRRRSPSRSPRARLRQCRSPLVLPSSTLGWSANCSRLHACDRGSVQRGTRR